MNLREFSSPALRQALRPNIWDIVALILVTGAMVLIVYGGEQTTAPLSTLDVAPVSLDPANLPLYALRTTLRMLLAIVCSMLFTFIYAALAAKSRRAEMVLIPLLDILQSVPILGFLTFTVVFFMNLFPGQRARRRTGLRVRDLHQPGLEHDVQHVPVAAHRAEGSGGGLAELPSQRLAAVLAARRAVRDAGPDLEHDDVDVRRLVLRGGLRSDHGRQHHGDAARHRLLRRAGASSSRTCPAIGYAILAMLLVIIAYDQLLFRPLVAWADKFRFEQTASGNAPTSWMLRSVPPHPRAAGAVAAVLGAEQGDLEPAYRGCRSRWKLARETTGAAVAHRRRALARADRRRHRLCRLADLSISLGHARPVGRARRVRLRPDHAAARHRADRAGHA